MKSDEPNDGTEPGVDKITAPPDYVLPRGQRAYPLVPTGIAPMIDSMADMAKGRPWFVAWRELEGAPVKVHATMSALTGVRIDEFATSSTLHSRRLD